MPRNVSASVFARLKGLPARDRDFNRLLQRFAAERFLYRLSVSPEAEHFTLKGAMLFLVWSGDAEPLRSTRDVDLTRARSATADSLRRSLGMICAIPCPEDGVVFSSEPIPISDLPVDRTQPGGAVRARIEGTLGTARLSVQVDIGFGDIITPERCRESLPTLLDHPKPVIWTYPRETAIAEKLHSMTRFGVRHTRIKDIWDVAALATRFSFDGRALRLAVQETFRQRGSVVDGDPPPTFRDAFYGPEQEQFWASFRRTSTIWAPGPATLSDAARILREFLEPVWRSAARDEPFELVWPPGGPWRAADRKRGTEDG